MGDNFMKIESVFDSAFAPYGKVLPGYDTSGLLEALEKYTPLPEATDYVASQPELEALPIAAQLASCASRLRPRCSRCW